jgi:Flp pilus assembly protein protease CpaA
LFFIGIVLASLQDLKRREVDNWLNLFLLVVSFSFVFFRAVLERDVAIVFHASFALVVLFVVMNVFYYGRIFAGGDAKLLFAMTVFFIGATFYGTLINIWMFVLFLMVAGSIYGLVYSFVLYFKDSRKANEKIVEFVREVGFGAWAFGIFLILLGFLYWAFFVFGVFVLLGLGLYVFAKGIEAAFMFRIVSGKDLKEGDWLVEDIKIGDKIIRADWDGLLLDDIEVLKKRRFIKIKEGLPFVPAFLIAFLLYTFFSDWVISFFMVF